MGLMNLLQGHYSGAVGQTVGAKWRGLDVLKSRTEGKAPPSSRQKQNLLAFQPLVRLSSAIAARDFVYFGLSEKKMLKHNAIAKFLKPCVKNHIFEVENIKDVIPERGRFYASTLSFDVIGRKFRIGFDEDATQPIYTDWYQINIVIDAIGNIVGYNRRMPETRGELFVADFIGDQLYKAISFIVAFQNNEWKPVGFSVAEVTRMDFSQGEQATPDIWIDGRRIYAKAIYADVQLTIAAGDRTSPPEVIDPTLTTGYVDNVIAFDWSWDENSETSFVNTSTAGVYNSVRTFLTVTLQGLLALAAQTTPSTASFTHDAVICGIIYYTKAGV